MCTLGFYLFILYIGVLNFGQIIWDKTHVLLGTSWGTHVGTFWELNGNIWEHIKNKGKKQKTPPTPPPKGKNRAHHECMLNLCIGCMKFLFLKLFVIVFGQG
jgi:hypothetical protein